ncbi:hypothetical protein CC86DRAFT_11657 [Ophiobolus disseminans]|uniref:Uncharacterized protein n=1 Tax=Ophiobolus disseminans TaxID=1469910 RepID=A0A6A7ALL4_9PLEO|nr:hypothetical protein CC86DRAFT_11657 [Ophiobolus disseminans]
MAKAKRMSDIFASSANKDVNATTTAAVATPPYSSEGPTLPVIEGDGDHMTNGYAEAAGETVAKGKSNAAKKKNRSENRESTTKLVQPVATNHPALYEPWTLLSRDILGLLLSQSRLADTKNVVPVVFTKNQNIKGGILRLTTYLRAHLDQKNPIELPEPLKKHESIIAISAQGDGATKLVSIVDMVRRIVVPKTALEQSDKAIVTWCMYTSLASVEVERKNQSAREAVSHREGSHTVQDTQEEEAFEPMDVDVPEEKTNMEPLKMRRVPVLTVWMTKKRLPAFKDAFGEQTFLVHTLPEEA